MTDDILLAEKQHLNNLLEATERCSSHNHSAHGYENECEDIAQHFNSRNDLRPFLFQAAIQFTGHCQPASGISPAHPDFDVRLSEIVSAG